MVVSSLNNQHFSSLLKMLDARPGFIIKILKRSLIDKFIITRAFDCQSAVFDR